RPSVSTLFPYTTLFRSYLACSIRNSEARAFPGYQESFSQTKGGTHESSLTRTAYFSRNAERNLCANCRSEPARHCLRPFRRRDLDRKSTRLNSSHVAIS